MTKENNNSLCVKYSRKNGKGIWDFNYAFLFGRRKVIPLTYVLNSHRYSSVRPYYLLEQRYRREREEKRRKNFRNKNQKCLLLVCFFLLLLSSVLYAKNVIKAAIELNVQERKNALFLEEMNQNVLNAVTAQKTVFDE